ncbi:MAG: acetyl-CoA carboxylase carboxyl transferase subunit beta, partial [Hydrogenobacter thermophilus]|nr:acetyl-CoA carboxylase carboxyl transferase subunit beta [Hydrogenobacter thermophilus]
MGILDKFFRKKREEKESLWTKCPECKTILYIPELSANLKVCPKCNYHFPMNAKERVESLLDGDVEVLFENILPKDPLGFKDTKPYKDRIRQAQDETGMSEAILVVRGRLRDIPMVLTVMDFGFIGGSMGSVVGERFYRAC